MRDALHTQDKTWMTSGGRIWAQCTCGLSYRDHGTKCPRTTEGRVERVKAQLADR